MKLEDLTWEPLETKLPQPAQPQPTKPLARLPYGGLADARAYKSRINLCRDASKLIAQAKIDRGKGLILWRKTLNITGQYWMDKRYDNQASYAQIKRDLTKFRRRISTALVAFEELTNPARKEINLDRSLSDERKNTQDYVETVRIGLEKLQKAAANRLPAHCVGGSALAVDNCCEALASLWEEATGKRFGVTYSKATGSGGRTELTSPGPFFLQLALQAIDPEIEMKKLHTWLKNRLSRKK